VTIFVGNLSHQAKREDLEEVFAEYGTVKKVVLPLDRETGRMRGFGFVDMASDEQEETAIKDLDGAEWMGRQLRVNKARPREDNPPNRERGSRGGDRDRF
jgi:RNA recognition motif-containing protein